MVPIRSNLVLSVLYSTIDHLMVFRLVFYCPELCAYLSRLQKETKEINAVQTSILSTSMKIALLQLNPTVGDLQGNSALIASAARRAKGADLAVTSELALLGYPPRDLLLNADFVERSWAALRTWPEELADLPPLLVGLAEPNPS